MLYLSLREVFIRNLSGTHDQIIPAGTPTLVIPALYDAANAAGCAPCDEAGHVIQPGVPSPEVVAPEVEVPGPEVEVEGAEPPYTILDITAVIEQLIARNYKDDFNSATGRPKVQPVAKLLGHKPTAEEIATAWELVEA